MGEKNKLNKSCGKHFVLFYILLAKTIIFIFQILRTAFLDTFSFLFQSALIHRLVGQ